MVSLCIALTASLTPGLTFAESKAEITLEKESVIESGTLNEMQTVPADFSAASEEGKEVTVHVNPEIQGRMRKRKKQLHFQ